MPPKGPQTLVETIPLWSVNNSDIVTIKFETGFELERHEHDEVGRVAESGQNVTNRWFNHCFKRKQL
jgi:hypothetical protein